MKRWFISLSALALALVLMQSTAMAFYKDAMCPKCQTVREFVRTDDYCWTPKEDMHMRVYRCPVCDRRQGMNGMLPHEESKAATCVSGAYCALCKTYRAATNPNNHTYTIVYNKVDEYNHFKKEVCSGCKKLNTSLTEQHRQKEAATCVSGPICADCGEAYGSPIPNAHNWTEWQPHMFSPNVHYRYCQNAGCGKYETEPHDGNSNCVTSATCSKCNATYKDTTKHKGPLTYTYEKEDENFHKKIESCDACGKRTGSFVSTQHVEKFPANCTQAAWCNDCKQTYGDPNPNNHDWDKWVYVDKNQHFRTCLNNDAHSQLADHRGNATCIFTMPCQDCGQLYNDPGKHQGPYTYAYASSASSANKHTVTETCTGCGKTSRTYDEAHDIVRHAPQAPTCKAEGWKSYETCKHCTYSTYSAIKPDPNAHVGTSRTMYVRISETQHEPHMLYDCCGRLELGSPEAHTPSTAATCTTVAYCAVCESSYGSTDPNNHVGEATTTYAKTSETQHTAMTTYSICKHTVTGTPEAHTQTTAATCTAAAYCAVCESSYGSTDPDAHNLKNHDAQAPTCTEIGWDAYETCSRCDYTTYAEKSALGHWYGEWAPNADGTHSAICRRGCGYRKTVPCTLLTCQLQSDAPYTAFTLCPVCGEVSDGTRLVLAEAAAKAVTGKLSAGEVVVRIGALAGGEQLMSVAFEWGGELTQPTGQVKITLPAELLAGYTLSLLSEDGTETELALETDEKAETVIFVLDFTDSEIPVQVIRLVPEV